MKDEQNNEAIKYKINIFESEPQIIEKDKFFFISSSKSHETVNSSVKNPNLSSNFSLSAVPPRSKSKSMIEANNESILDNFITEQIKKGENFELLYKKIKKFNDSVSDEQTSEYSDSNNNI